MTPVPASVYRSNPRHRFLFSPNAHILNTVEAGQGVVFLLQLVHDVPPDSNVHIQVRARACVCMYVGVRAFVCAGVYVYVYVDVWGCGWVCACAQAGPPRSCPFLMCSASHGAPVAPTRMLQP